MVDLNNKNVLITGGCGFIGSNFIEYINKTYNNLNILNVDKWGVGHRKMSHHLYENDNKYEEVLFDLCNLNLDDNLFWCDHINYIKFDYIFHFAAESHVDRSISGPQEFIYNNVMGITKLLEMVRLRQSEARVINVSTDEVYGHLKSYTAPPFTERSILDPRSPYSASKASADMVANSYASTYGLDVITTRCCNNFGPHQHDEKLIPTVVKNLVNNSGIPIYGDGKNMREWIYVDDHNKSILEIAGMDKPNGVYNIGSSTELSNLNLIQNIANILSIEPKLEYVEDRKGHDFRYALKSMRYFRKFKLESFPIALENTVRFYADKYAGNTK